MYTDDAVCAFLHCLYTEATLPVHSTSVWDVGQDTNGIIDNVQCYIHLPRVTECWRDNYKYGYSSVCNRYCEYGSRTHLILKTVEVYHLFILEHTDRNNTNSVFYGPVYVPVISQVTFEAIFYVCSSTLLHVQCTIMEMLKFYYLVFIYTLDLFIDSVH